MAEHPYHRSVKTPASAQPASTYRPTAEEAKLIRLSQEWMDMALNDRDEARLRSFMASDFTLQGWDASRAPQDLDGWMKTLLERLTEVEFEYTSLNAQVFGDIGVVYSTYRWKGAMDGQPFTDSGFLTDVWSRQSGSWQVVSRRSAGQQQIQQLQTP
jgi:ketosteroid isomerase-like protein